MSTNSKIYSYFFALPHYLSRVLTILSSLGKVIYFRSILLSGRKTQFLPSAKIDNICKKSDAIQIGNNTIIGGQLLTFAHGGQIEIGDWCYIGEGTRIWSAESIKIGNRVLISHNVNIHDTNSHPLEAKARHEHFAQIATSGHPTFTKNILSAPVIIEDDVWIGFNSIILKGVRIGLGSVVAAGSVVTKDVPSNTIVAGNPAQFIREVQ
jgi:acetyltransferase-like isoleucine patch superfamily enzyme